MDKTLRRIRKALFILAIIEIVCGILGAIFWYLDLFGIKTALPRFPEAYAGMLVIFFFVDVIFYWISVREITRQKQRSDLKVATLIGSDIEEAYNIDRLGLLVIDENNIVIWCNDLFTDLQLNLLDTNLFIWKNELKDLVNGPSNKKVLIEAQGRVFEVYYLASARMFVFKDETKYSELEKYSSDHATVLGIIKIDNYDDMASDTDDITDTIDRVRSAITEYFRDYGVLLRRMRNDTYFAVCAHESLKKMEQDKFSLLDKVRQEGNSDRSRLTLSIGFASNFPDIPKLNEMANKALDNCLARGGDQVVVSEHGQDLRYFGGKTAAVENTSRVKLRSIANSLTDLINKSTNVYVMGHMDADMDALGACLGILAICEWANKKCQIVYESKLIEQKTRGAFQQAFPAEVAKNITISPADAKNSIKPGTLLVVVDVADPKRVLAPALIDSASKIVVIDHHRRGDSYISNNVLDASDSTASSASELITEMIKYATANPPIEIKPSYATIMLSGIFLDTQFFKRKSTGIMTFEAAEVLKQFGADNSLANDYLKEEFEEYDLVNKIVATSRFPETGVVYCVCEPDLVVERSVLAKSANQLLEIQGVQAAFAIGRISDKQIAISARSNQSINVQLLMEKMGGGGHFDAAAGQFQGTNITDVVDELLTTLDDYLDTARNTLDKQGGH